MHMTLKAEEEFVYILQVVWECQRMDSKIAFLSMLCVNHAGAIASFCGGKYAFTYFIDFLHAFIDYGKCMTVGLV